MLSVKYSYQVTERNEQLLELVSYPFYHFVKDRALNKTLNLGSTKLLGGDVIVVFIVNFVSLVFLFLTLNKSLNITNKKHYIKL